MLHAPDEPDIASSEAGKRVGIAWALIGLLRAVPFHARQKRLYLPQDLVDAEGLNRADLFELRSSPALAAIVRQVAAAAQAHLEARGRGRPPRRSLTALLPASLARGHLRRLRRVGYDPFDPRLETTRSAVWRLALAALLGRP